MLKQGIITAVLLATFALPALSQADEVYSCKGSNSGLHFVVYTNGNSPRGGHMYLKNIQAAVLKPYRMNTYTIRAKIKGNTANSELILNKSRKAVYITIGNTSKKICDARVRID